jgi:hypothetical protein
MLKKSLVICLVMLLILPAAFSCSTTPATGALLVPGTASSVIQIQVNKIITSPALKLAYSQLAKAQPGWPQTADDAINQLFQKTGLDLAAITRLVLFADFGSANQTKNNYAGLIVSGTFNEPALIASIQKQVKQTFTTGNYKGLTTYSGTQDEFEIAFLGQSQLVMGTPQAIRDAVDVSKGDKKPLNGSIPNTLNRFGAALITGAFTPPASLRSQLGLALPKQVPVSLKALQDVDTIGFAVDQPGLNLSVRIDAHFSNTASLQDGRDEITGLISFAKGATQDPNIKTILSSIKVSAADSWLSVSGLTTMVEIASLISSMQAQK